MMKLTAIIKKDDESGLYVAWCPEVDIASQGKSLEDALNNLKEALELYFEDEDAVHPSGDIFVSVIEISPSKVKVST